MSLSDAMIIVGIIIMIYSLKRMGKKMNRKDRIEEKKFKKWRSTLPSNKNIPRSRRRR